MSAVDGGLGMSALPPLLGAERTSAPFWLMSTAKLPRSGSLTTGPGVALQWTKSAPRVDGVTHAGTE
jgi:hypothetical protein